MKTGYLAYAIYNLDDGTEISPLGVYGDEDTAIDMLVAELEEYTNADATTTAEAYEALFKSNVVYNDTYNAKFAYVGVGVEL